ncbi:DNA primase small subunit isoform X2 [Chrysoperla carnea]|uniref:DNA primase small subunit isoform X2 n=1 Tax=Chrysoperla carnea TaxID=189513 RepID=UPI001D098D83|nr:DNA primase small subunit isoform X2 [Chrysoperla carnea]
MTSTLSEFPELLKVYYRRLFPFDTYFDWLNYEHEEKQPFEKREFSFTLPGDIYIRYNTFQTKEELVTEIQRELPIKIDLGAEYNIRPNRFNSRNNDDLRPVRREVVFDIDMTDYDTVRKCCKGGDICAKCWKFMEIAVKIIDTTLREDFNYHHLLWVYSGRRGVHCWVCDQDARRSVNRARKGMAEYFSIIPKNKKNKNLYRRSKLHNFILRSINLIDTYWVDLCLKDQDILGTPEDITEFLKHIGDDKFAGDLEKEFAKHDNSVDRWNAFSSLVDYYSQKGMLKFYMQHIREEMKIFYAFPRIDENVSKTLKHLLKSPFCVHPKTGKVCVPFNPKVVEKFNPFTVPTLRVLLDEVNQFDTAPDDPSVPSFSITSAKDNRKTSLIKALLTFEQFVARLQRLKGMPPDDYREE